MQQQQRFEHTKKTSSGPEGKVAESGSGLAASRPLPRVTHECTMRNVPMRALALSWAAQCKACCARTRPTA
eukprot:5318866-Amphidinium_carterae.1